MKVMINFNRCKWALIAIFLFSTVKVYSQQPLGLVVGDLNTPYSVFMNPANVASNYSKRFYVNWWGTSLEAQSSFASSWKHESSSLRMDQTWMPKSQNQNWSLNYLNETYGPSMFFMADNKVGFGLGVKAVSGFNFQGVSPDLGNILRYGRSAWDKNIGGTIKQQTPFAFNTDKYQEWYLSFGSYAGDASARKGFSAFKWGATTKLLIGMGAAHLSASTMEVQYLGNNNLQFNQLNASYMYTDAQSASSTMNAPLGFKFGLMSGVGAGADIGFMYELRPGMKLDLHSFSGCERELKRTYKVKFGASLTDIGFIAYDGSSNTVGVSNYSYKMDSAFSIGQMYGVSSVNQSPNAFDQIESAATKLPSNTQRSFTTYTPMAFNMQMDIRSGNWHLGGYLVHSLKPVDMPGLRRSSSLSFVPRYQSERFEYGMPISLANDYTQLQVGGFVRFGPIIIGSNNLWGLGNFMRNTGTQGASFYIGFRSKIGDCNRYTDQYDVVSQDSTVVVNEEIKEKVTHDTIVKIVRDTIVKTEIKTVIKHDTVVVNKNTPTPINPAVQQALNDCKKREEALKKQLSDIQLKEVEASNKAKNCETDLVKWKGDYDRLKADDDRIRLELDRVKFENDRLKAENAQLKAVAVTPIDKQAKRCDSLLQIELLKNQKLATDLAIEKSKSSNCEKSLIEVKKQIDVLAGEKKRLEDQLKAVTVGEDCTPYKNKISQLEQLLAAEKTKSANLSAELETLKKSIADIKQQLSAEQAKTKDLEAKLKLCIPKDQLDKALTDLEAAKKRIAELEVALKNASSGNDCSKTRDSLSQALVDLESKKNAYDALMAEYQDCQKALKQLKADLKACEDKLAAAGSSTSSSEIDALKSEISKLKMTITQLNGEVDAGRKSLDDCQKSIDDKDIAIKDLQDKLNAKTAEVSTLQSQLKTAQAQLLDAKARLAKCEEEKAALQNNGSGNAPTGSGTSGGTTPGGSTPMGGGN
jgi:predicted  nucleic acid-binding Zn-ribbon protein